MKECVCCQCSDWPVGDAPEYFQCEACQHYGTIDDFASGDDTCWDCRDKECGGAEQAVELGRERSAFTMTVLRGGK